MARAVSDLSIRLRAFRLSLHDVVATDVAVVAMAAAPAQVRLIRRGLAGLPAIGEVSSGDMAHMTLFRSRQLRMASSAGIVCAEPFCTALISS